MRKIAQADTERLNNLNNDINAERERPATDATDRTGRLWPDAGGAGRWLGDSRLRGLSGRAGDSTGSAPGPSHISAGRR